MGNEASSAVAMAGAKNQFNETMKSVNETLGGTAKKDTDGLAGCASKKESAERKKQREQEFEQKKKEREERKKKLSEQWTSHRNQNN